MYTSEPERTITDRMWRLPLSHCWHSLGLSWLESSHSTVVVLPKPGWRMSTPGLLSVRRVVVLYVSLATEMKALLQMGWTHGKNERQEINRKIWDEETRRLPKTWKMGGLCRERSRNGGGGRKVERKGQQKELMIEITIAAIHWYSKVMSDQPHPYNKETRGRTVILLLTSRSPVSQVAG